MPRALITGITGQDGSYLAEFLLAKGYDVYGLLRRDSQNGLTRIAHIKDALRLIPGDLRDQSSLDDAVRTVQPDEVYNLAALSFIPASWQQPVLTADVTGLGAVRLLDAVRRFKPDARFYQASSSEMFGEGAAAPQHERTPLRPRNPYGIAKVCAYQSMANYRETCGLFACSGICFNHESPRRGAEFLTRKVTLGVARIKHGQARELHLGNLQARRDWGFAPDYVQAMWMMLQQSDPDDYVVATSRTHSVQDLVDLAFAFLGLSWQEYVVVDPGLYRQADTGLLVGDASKARQKLGWAPRTPFWKIVELMVESDLNVVRGAVAAV